MALVTITSLSNWFDAHSKRIRQSNIKLEANRRRRKRPMKAISDEFALRPKSFRYYLAKSIVCTLYSTCNNKGP